MENLKKSLEQLHKELQNAKSVDPESEMILRNLLEDIHSLIERTEGKEITKHSLINELKKSAQSFQVSHPEVSNAIRIVINSLSNIGV